MARVVVARTGAKRRGSETCSTGIISFVVGDITDSFLAPLFFFPLHFPFLDRRQPCFFPTLYLKVPLAPFFLFSPSGFPTLGFSPIFWYASASSEILSQCLSVCVFVCVCVSRACACFRVQVPVQ